MPGGDGIIGSLASKDLLVIGLLDKLITYL